MIILLRIGTDIDIDGACTLHVPEFQLTSNTPNIDSDNIEIIRNVRKTNRAERSPNRLVPGSNGTDHF